MNKILKSLILLLSTFALYSSQEKQLIKLNDKGILSVVTQAFDIKNIIADYLENKWEIDKIIPIEARVNQAKFSPDGKYIACATAFRDIKIFEIDTKKEIKTLEGHTKQVHCIDYSPDGNI